MRFFLAVILLLLPASLWAACGGTDLRTTLPAENRARIESLIAAAPFGEGNHWIARRGGRTVHVIGTLHFSDPRMDQIAADLAPVIAEADTLLLEASPSDKAAFENEMGRTPSLMLITEGPSLIDRLPPEEWDELADTVRSQGIPPWMAAKMRPWFLAVSMAIPPCLRQAKDIQNGLDMRLGNLAEAAGVPVRSLEDPMAVIRMMDAHPLEDQVRQLRAYISMLGSGEDYFFTTSESYFDEQALFALHLSEQQFLDSSTLTPAESEALWAESMAGLLTLRNRAWIPVIEAAEGDRIVVAAGALHLPGEDGVLNLLQQQGYSLERAPF